MSYEYLIAGLDELREGQSGKLSEEGLLELMQEQLSKSDWQLLQLLRRRRDDPQIQALLEDDAVQDRFRELQLSEEDFREQLLYEQGMQSRNTFVRSWFEFNLNLNNVLAAAICQKHGYDPQKVIVGDNEVAQQLRKGNILKNANLAAVLPELREITALADVQNLLEREKRQEALRWQWLDEQTTFHYFDIEAVLAYYLKTTILHRWDNLTKEQGERIFREMLADMKRDIKFN